MLNNKQSIERISYFVTRQPTDVHIQKIINNVKSDVTDGRKVTQLFFYGDAVSISMVMNYSSLLQRLINLTDDLHIPLYICSAGIEKRGYQLNELTAEDLTLKGIGQFIVESQAVEKMRVF